MKTGWILKCGEMFFVGYMKGKLTLTSDAKDAWFSEDESASTWMRDRAEMLTGLTFQMAVYTHVEGGVRV